jgi:lipopolysaccharide transport system permease protein
MSSTETTLVIEAGRAERNYWTDLWRYRELLGFLAWRDIKVRYKQATLGVAWAVIQPAVQTLLLTFVFSKLAKMPGTDVPYPLLVLAGLLPWQLFSSAFSGAGASLVGNANLISKVYFPRLLVPLSAVAVALIDMAIPLILGGPIAIMCGVMPTWRLLVLPFFIIAGLAMALAAGIWTAAITVKYRDFRFIAPFILQIGIFVTPVGFGTGTLPNWRVVMALNPLTSIVEGFRWCLLGGRTDIYMFGLVMALLLTAATLAGSINYFRATERRFADII